MRRPARQSARTGKNKRAGTCDGAGPIFPLYFDVDEELAPPGLLEDAAEPPLDDGALDDDPPMPPLLLDVPPEADESAGAGAVVVVDEDDEPPGTTMVSFSLVVVVVDEDAPLGAVVVDPPGTTVVVSFFSHAASAKAPISTNKYPLRLIVTLLSSEFTLAKCTAGLAIDVPAPGPLVSRGAPWTSRARPARPARSAFPALRGSATTTRGRDDRPSPRT